MDKNRHNYYVKRLSLSHGWINHLRRTENRPLLIIRFIKYVMSLRKLNPSLFESNCKITET